MARRSRIAGEICRKYPASTETSLAMSKALKKRNFNFVGETICYAFMQATGMVNDHCTDCFRYKPCQKLSIKQAC